MVTAVDTRAAMSQAHRSLSGVGASGISAELQALLEQKASCKDLDALRAAAATRTELFAELSTRVSESQLEARLSANMEAVAREMRDALERSHADAVKAVARRVASQMQEVTAAVQRKADRESVEAELARKADVAHVREALALKADADAVQQLDVASADAAREIASAHAMLKDMSKVRVDFCATRSARAARSSPQLTSRMRRRSSAWPPRSKPCSSPCSVRQTNLPNHRVRLSRRLALMRWRRPAALALGSAGWSRPWQTRWSASS